MYCVHEPVFVSPDMAQVNIEAFEKEDRELLRKGRVRDALNLLNSLEQCVNTPGVINPNWLVDAIKAMKSYDPNNK